MSDLPFEVVDVDAAVKPVDKVKRKKVALISGVVVGVVAVLAVAGFVYATVAAPKIAEAAAWSNVDKSWGCRPISGIDAPDDQVNPTSFKFEGQHMTLTQTQTQFNPSSGGMQTVVVKVDADLASAELLTEKDGVRTYLYSGDKFTQVSYLEGTEPDPAMAVEKPNLDVKVQFTKDGGVMQMASTALFSDASFIWVCSASEAQPVGDLYTVGGGASTVVSDTNDIVAFDKDKVNAAKAELGIK